MKRFIVSLRRLRLARSAAPISPTELCPDRGSMQQPKTTEAKASQSVATTAVDWLIKFVVFSPLAWLALLEVCLVVSLYVVGYLSEIDDGERFRTVLKAIEGDVDIAARRAALAYSGVILAVTVALSITSLLWTTSTFLGKGPAFPNGPSASRRLIVACGAVLALVIFVALLGLRSCDHIQPFPTRLGNVLLLLAEPGADGKIRGDLNQVGVVPMVMFCLAILVPELLATGATLLVSDVRSLKRDDALTRLQELDHLLYIGALALVFGTLQLSAALSVPLTGFPKTADIRLKLELCKLLDTQQARPSRSASNQVNDAAAAASAHGYAVMKCGELPNELNRNQTTDSVRQLVRSVTVALGLAFSALLVGIYVPAQVVLRMRVAAVPQSASTPSEKTESPTKELDPYQRITAFAATLSPLVASLVANAFMGAWTGQ